MSSYSYAANNAFVKYSKSEGLVQNTVTNSLEDTHGYMWFSTFEGLSRFDGYEFKNYRHSKSDPTSLPHNFTKKLLLDSQGNLWVATKNGLAKYNSLKDNFTNYNKDNSQLNSNEIFTIALNKDGNLLVSTAANLYLYDDLASSFLPFTVNGKKLPADIKVIFSEPNKTWIGSLASGIFILEHSSNTLYSLKESNPWNLKIEAKYIFDFKKINNNYWLATEIGAYKIDPNLSSVKLLNSQNTPSLVGNDVRSILQNHNGNIWLGTTTGISILNRNFEHLHSYNNQNNINFGLESSHILSLYKDSNNSIWLGTYSGALYRYNADSSEIKMFNKTSIETTNASGMSGNTIWGLSEDSKEKIWIGTQSSGLNRLDAKNFVFKQFLSEFIHNIWAIKVDELDQIWVASSGGIFIYKQQSDTALKLIETVFPGENILTIIYFFGRMWLRTEDGIIKWIDPKNLQINEIDLANNKINYIKPLLVDVEQNLWLNTNLGMVLYNLDSKLVRQLVIDLENPVRHFNSVIEVND
ncbi:two-component regulator propeller domain-containing protein, partial [uncultured Paraglaciecola sp.]|uniref:ligand-binding sensor domain-containing protein n=1 Tax=uncultured Paraglaciecola sp. TaxID=1765024 RepID=UPI002600FD53